MSFNLEWTRARVDLNEGLTNEVLLDLTAAIAKRNTEDSIVLSVENAHRTRDRLEANLGLIQTLMKRIEDYEERIALLK